MSSRESSRARIIVACCCLSYLSVGIASGALGPLLPELAARTSITLSEGGLLFSFYFLGGVISRMAAGVLSDRYGAVPIVAGGLAAEVLSALAFSASRSAALLYTSSLLLGASSGAALLGAVLIAARVFPDRSVATVNLVNVFWGVGSFAGPALFSAASALVRSGLPVIWVAGALAVATILLLLREGAGSEPMRVSPSPSAAAFAPTDDASTVRSLFAMLPFWLFAAILLFDVGVESTIGGWTAVYLHGSTPLDLQKAALVVSGFYACFTIGRMAAAGAASRMGARPVLAGGLLAALVGMGLVSAAPGRLFLSVIGFLLAGLGVGPIYPTITAIVSSSFGRRAGTAVGMTGSIGFVGGVFFPWVAGLAMPAFGAVSAMRLVEAILVVVALLAFIAVGGKRSPLAAGSSSTRRSGA